jgi:hypothetical protein
MQFENIILWLIYNALFLLKVNIVRISVVWVTPAAFHVSRNTHRVKAYRTVLTLYPVNYGRINMYNVLKTEHLSCSTVKQDCLIQHWGNASRMLTQVNFILHCIFLSFWYTFIFIHTPAIKVFLKFKHVIV